MCTTKECIAEIPIFAEKLFAMKKLLFVLSLFFIACSSEPDVVKSGRNSYKQYFEKVLKDPSSLVIYNESYELTDDGTHVHFTVDYGAKNSFGGMERKTIHFESGFAGTNLKANGEYVGW